MRSGKLRDRLQFMTLTEVTGNLGKEQRHVPGAPVAAEVRLSTTDSIERIECLIRYRQVSASAKVLFQGREFEVVSVAPDPRRRSVEFSAERRHHK